MNQNIIDAQNKIIDLMIKIERKHFFEVEFNNKAEWLHALKNHIYYQYIILTNNGDMLRVEAEIQELWITEFDNE